MNDRSRPGPLRKCARGLAMAVAAVVVSLVSGAAFAAEPGRLPIELGWEAPETCPRSDDIERDVRRFLGDAPIPDAAPSIVARVSVRQNPDATFDVRVRTTSNGEVLERELRVETCDEARHLVAFLLAFLIDPRAQERPRPEPPPAATAALPAPVVRAPPAASRPVASVQRYPRWIASVLAGADVGMLPSVSLGGELRAGLLFPGWSLEARAAAWLPRRAESPTLAGAGGEFTLFDVGALGCLRSAPWEAPRIQVCAGPTLSSLAGNGYGVDRPGEEQALFAGVAVEAATLVAISSRTSLRLGLGALVPLSRPTFAIRGVGPIHRPSALAGRASLGFEVHF